MGAAQWLTLAVAAAVNGCWLSLSLAHLLALGYVAGLALLDADFRPSALGVMQFLALPALCSLCLVSIAIAGTAMTFRCLRRRSAIAAKLWVVAPSVLAGALWLAEQMGVSTGVWTSYGHAQLRRL